MSKEKVYFIGMDAGATKTASVLQNEKGEILASQKGDAGNFLIRGTDEVARTLCGLVTGLCGQANISPKEVSAVASGHTGAGRIEDADRMKQSFMNLWQQEQGYPLSNVFIYSDARIALEGAFSGKPGSILIAGTGSIMFGKDSKGNIHRVGGLGRFIGDEGSGYTLGRKGFNVVAKYFDGRMDKTLLVDVLKEKFGIDGIQKIISEVYKNNFDLAKIAIDVIDAAGNGDNICKRIVLEEVEELVMHLKAMYFNLKEKEMKVSLIGSIVTTENFFAKEFRNTVKQIFDDIKICEPELSPEAGAILMAKDELK